MNTILKVLGATILAVVLCICVDLLHVAITQFVRSEIKEQVKTIKQCNCGRYRGDVGKNE